ncbi:G protein-regulated inducer of neurite outgrowth 1 [Spea bombifrons]|uniref:G protein-regulated inducer of neurite outgrowth 1 n=1 Tax=Spea bombifrons TaxID=233779 RepID=UPI00234BC255|nr:G protein-regulated inducer of neurite outgrowth 1 [Spea bombifrons]
MGSPKELQRLQLSKPDAGSENISLRSPISSRIWQADDPTRHLGFTGEDLSMRNFCVSVHGDADFLEGSFSFDTEGDSFRALQRIDSVDALSTIPVMLAEEENKSLKQQDSTDLTTADNTEHKSHLEKCLEECTFTATGFSELTNRDFKSPNDVTECGKVKQDQPPSQDITHRGGYSETTQLDRVNLRCFVKIDHEPVLHKEHLYGAVESSSDFKKEESSTEMGTAKDKVTSHTCGTDIVPSQVPSSVEEITTIRVTQDSSLSVTSNIDSSLNTMTGPIGDNTLRDILPETSTKVKEDKMIHGKPAPNQDANTFVDERKTETMTDGKTGCEEAANGDFNAKTHSYELVPSNNDRSTQADKVEYRSIAISPIVPPDGSSSFTFQTGMATKGTSSVANSYNVRTAGKESTGREEQPKTSSFEPNPPNQDVGTETRVQCRSIAVSPIVPPGGSTSFTFQTENPQATKSVQGSSDQLINIRGAHNLHKPYSTELTPSIMNVGTETKVEYKSVAVSPIIPPDGSSFTFQTQKSFNITAGVQPSQGGDTLSKTYSFELTPPNQDVGSQADTRAERVSIAVSPIIPPGQLSTFIFHTEQKNEEMFGSAGKAGESTPIQNQTGTPHKQNHSVGTQADTKVQCISVAVSPFVLPDGSSSFPFLIEKTAQNQPADNKTDKDVKNTENLPKTYSFELTPPEEDTGTATCVEYRSVALSPFVPPGESSFSFLSEKQEVSSKMYELTKPSQEIGTQADNKVDCVSVAVSPIALPQGSSTFNFQTEQKSQESSALPAAQSLQLKPHNLKDVGTQVETNVQCTSIAVSPFMPMEGSCSFTFHTGAANQDTPCPACSYVKPVMKDAGMQVSFVVETRSAATDPMTPTGKSSCATYPEVRVKEPKGDHPEPVREVSWDEKGMTWEVYGASMEVEVLGMAIQKHLEKQIEEHGRQKVLTPQNTRGSSIRGTTGKGETKRQPSTFRTFFHRRPRCCSKAGPAVE